MENKIGQLIKENILQRKQNISDFLKNASSSVVSTRIGHNRDTAVDEQLKTFDQLLKSAENETLGRCEICHEIIDTARLEMDYTACVCIEHLTREERTKLENDLELSQKVQKALLPHTLPSIQGLEIAAYSQPARIVGGDYFDFLRFKDGNHALAIADVMGKGMPASMLMANLQASLRILTPESSNPAEVITRLNCLFCHNIRLTKFVTFFLAQYDESTRTLNYCNAGHNPPLVYRSDGSLEWLSTTGAAIGLIEQTDFNQESVILNKGDRLILYTDGVVEAFNKRREMFGEERLAQFFRDSSDSSAPKIIASLRKTLKDFTQTDTPADDTTIIVLNSVRFENTIDK